MSHTNTLHTPPVTISDHVKVLAALGVVLAIIFSFYSYTNDLMIAYGDAESHLNISKRVTDSLTPGLAQLGGIWLPLPHLLMAPLTAINTLWFTGLAGAIISGIFYVMSSVFLFLLVYEFTKGYGIAWIGALAFMLNPNILYLQSTAMTEIPLIAFFLGSIYFFIKFLKTSSLAHILLAGIFGLAATLSRYDGWFLVGMQLIVLFVWYVPDILKAWKNLGLRKMLASRQWRTFEGISLIFATMSFVGILLWFLWGYMILNDPLYFTNSPFSAKSQQQGWLSHGMLPAYQNMPLSWMYYQMTSMRNIGEILSVTALVGVVVFLFHGLKRLHLMLFILFMTPFIFYVITQYMGQSVIFIPDLTPDHFEWQLFNVRYGVMMIPAAAFFLAYLAYMVMRLFDFVLHQFIKRQTVFGQAVAVVMALVIIATQTYSFVSKDEPIITLEDGVSGLSSAAETHAQGWIKENYDHGLVLIDDYARTMSIIKIRLPMEKVIYVGNKPYWEDALEEPDRQVRWIVMQDGDAVWSNFLDNGYKEGQLYAHYNKAYTSPEILIFKRIDSLTQN